VELTVSRCPKALGPQQCQAASLPSSLVTKPRVLATKHLGQGHEKLERYKNPNASSAEQRWAIAAFCSDVLGASYQSLCYPNTCQALAERTGTEERGSDCWGSLLACWRLPSSTGVCWRGTQGTFGPQHVKHPGKSNPPGQENSFKRKRKKNKRCNSAQELPSLTLRTVQSCSHRGFGNRPNPPFTKMTDFNVTSGKLICIIQDLQVLPHLVLDALFFLAWVTKKA